MTDSFAIVLAGGGERLIAWQAGVLAGLADGGLDPRRARTVVGTSAGALVAARLAAGADPLANTTPNAQARPRSAPGTRPRHSPGSPRCGRRAGACGTDDGGSARSLYGTRAAQLPFAGVTKPHGNDATAGDDRRTQRSCPSPA